MTRDDILRLVEESGFDLYMFSSKGRDSFELFANLVAAHEREACEKLAEPKYKRPCSCERCDCGNQGNAEEVAVWDAEMAIFKAIRARGSDPCPECGGAGIILVPNTDVMPCPHCLSNNPTG
jgi:hypothetical protein